MRPFQKMIGRLLRLPVRHGVRWLSQASRVALLKDAMRINGSDWSMDLHYLWLRDHCLCDQCYNHQTNQRKFDLLSVRSDVRPEEATVAENDQLSVTWPGGHKSTYSLSDLRNSQTNEEQGKRKLWSGEQMAEQGVAGVDYAEVMESHSGLAAVYDRLSMYGMAAVTNTPHEDAQITERLMARVGLIQETVFGSFWVFSAKMQEHEDTAYTNEALGAHNDSTYYSRAPGLQVFHCLAAAPEGGETLLVDGFHAAERLRDEDPDSFEFLSSTPIPHQYIEKGTHLRCDNLPVIVLHPLTKQLLQIRFNPYDRAPLVGFSMEQIERFYRSYSNYSRIVRDKKSEFWCKLQPGTVLFIDNWRVMHGRAAFQGHRELCGGYISRDDYLSRARTVVSNN